MTSATNVDTSTVTAPKHGKAADDGATSTTRLSGKAAMPRRVATAPPTADSVLPSPQPAPGKLDRLVALLAAPGGATIAAMMAATGWQAHSVRGAMAGALRKRGLVVTSAKIDGVRTYHASRAA